MRRLLPVLALLCAAAAPALARSETKTVRYRGYVLRVPSSWRVYDLARAPWTCVRFDRHAVYLGVPSRQQRCPAHAAGRRSAILLEPAGHGVRRITSPEQTIARGPAPAARRADPSAHAASVYTGLGFDACSTPSTRTMSAWSSSPYRAIGVYIGGVNSACSQGNLSRGWVATEVGAHWHLIPIYVGLQAPSNSCGCSSLSPGRAAAEGATAADDAVADAQGLGIPSGNPIYYDMEAYPNGGTTTSAVLTFLAAWTSELHAKGYLSGVYSSASSGISDLASRYGTSYTEPDDLWIADWNGEKGTSDPYVPSSDWSNHRRLHQYSGDHTETYGGVQLDIDGDYLDGATAGTSGGGGGGPRPKPPAVSISTTPDGTTSIGASWSGHGLAAWRVLAGESPDNLSSTGGGAAHGARALFRLANGSPYFAVQALAAGGKVLSSSAAARVPAHLALFGHSGFVSETGTGGLPVGCYTGHTCHIATKIVAAGVVIASTGTESIPSGSTGLLYFTLTQTGRFMLANARGGRLPVQVGLRDVSGTRAALELSLVGFQTSGPEPPRSVSQAPPIRILGTTDFVPSRGLGGILAACSSPAPCHVAVTISAGGRVVAHTGSETIGGEEAGYVFFPVSAAGRRLLASAPGNHLEADIALAQPGAVARAVVALVSFS